jgi:hypothetical protein
VHKQAFYFKIMSVTLRFEVDTNNTTKGGTGITAGRDVSIGDVSDQVTIGKSIN